MSYILEEIINKKLVNIFEELGFDKRFAIIKNSDRPDLSDFQCNGALALAKTEKKNPRQIAEMIAEKLNMDKDFSKISVDGPGFLNITLNDDLIAETMNKMV